MSEKPVDVEDDDLTVEEIEAKLKSCPKDEELRMDLARALVNRHIYGENGHPAGDRADLDRANELLSNLPMDEALYDRAYLAYQDKKMREFMELSTKWASEYGDPDEKPISADSAYFLFDYPFPENPPEVWGKWAKALEGAWKGSAVVLTFRGLSKWHHENKPEEAISDFVLALEKDPSFWLAAWNCAEIYCEQENWRSAYGYFLKALKGAPDIATAFVPYRAAGCCFALKDYAKAEKHLRQCYEVSPDFSEGRNDLGWCLYKQGKYEEALQVFDEAIKRGEDGKYPLRNRARVLAKLGRYEEAIEAWQKCSHRGVISKGIQEEISKLRDVLAKMRLGQAVVVDELPDEVEEAESVAEEEEEQAVSPQKTKQGTPRLTVKTEKMLEEMVEDMINKGKEVFGKTLRMFGSPDGSAYGRQYATPIGLIDLLTEETKTGDYVVVELKRDESDDQVIGQISRYISWVREHLAKNGKKVYGVVCVKNASQKLLLAARNTPGVEVYEYDLSFRAVPKDAGK